MPKNVKGGNKAKKGKNSQPAIVAKEIVYPDKSGYQFYAIMEQFLGHTSNMVMLQEVKTEKGATEYKLDNKLGLIRGKILKKCKPKRGDVFLVCTRDFSDKQVDIIHKYTEDNIRDLRRDGTFPQDFMKLIDAYGSADSNASSKTVKQIQEEDAEHIEFDELYEQPELSLDFTDSSSGEEDN